MGTLDYADRRALWLCGINYAKIEIRRDPGAYKLLFRQWGLPNAIDVGHGIFSRHTGRLYIDDDTGKAVAYIPAGVISGFHRGNRRLLSGLSGTQKAEGKRSLNHEIPCTSQF